MRKYQQLLLLVLSGICCIVLLSIKNENNRLKYVLKVVNFFGRNDSDVSSIQLNNNVADDDEQQDFADQPPVWQAISENNFHAYNAYWKRKNPLQAGEALSLVVGKRGIAVNFSCALNFNNSARIVQGKFRFQRLEEHASKNNDFESYIFFCSNLQQIKEEQPESVSFSDATRTLQNTAKLSLQVIHEYSDLNTQHKSLTGAAPAVCLDLTSFNQSDSLTAIHLNILQFFHHHKLIGIAHFLLYNSVALPKAVLRSLHHSKIRFYAFPFNFPLPVTNHTSSRFRNIIETDCMLRTAMRAQYSLVLSINEFFYPNIHQLGNSQSLLNAISHFTPEVNRLEIPTFSTCFDVNKKLLMDNFMYDSEERPPYRQFLFRSQLPPLNNALPTTHHNALPLTTAFVHHYTKCEHVSADGLRDWRSSLRIDFLQLIHNLHNKMNILFKA